MSRTKIHVALVAAVALAATGCSVGASTVASTAPTTSAVAASSSSPSTPSPTSAATSASATASPSAAPLTRAEVAAVLPPPAAFGAAWVDATTSRTMTSSKDVITPSSCRPLYDVLAGDPLVPLVATAKRDYRPGSQGPFVTVVVRSFPQSPVDTVLAPVAQALASCPTFTSLTTEGRTTSYTAAPLSLPGLGDRTLGFELVATSGTFSITLQVALTAAGTTEVSVVNAGIGTPPQRSTTLAAMNRTLARLPR